MPGTHNTDELVIGHGGKGGIIEADRGEAGAPQLRQRNGFLAAADERETAVDEAMRENCGAGHHPVELDYAAVAENVAILRGLVASRGPFDQVSDLETVASGEVGAAERVRHHMVVSSHFGSSLK